MFLTVLICTVRTFETNSKLALLLPLLINIPDNQQSQYAPFSQNLGWIGCADWFAYFKTAHTTWIFDTYFQANS